MIGQIRGKLLTKENSLLLVETGGIGYEIHIPLSTLYVLPQVMDEVCLHTHLIVREDAHLLFGFASLNERNLFRQLLKINGIGPRSALAILSSSTIEDFIYSVQHNNTEQLTKLPGIGKKTAERLIIEMRDKIDHIQDNDNNGTNAALIPKNDVKSARHIILQDAVSALIALGFKSFDANKMIKKIDDGLSMSEELIKKALKELT